MYRVDITNDGDFSFKVKSDDYGFAMDRRGKGITPSATFLASLGACIGVYLRRYSEGTKLGLKEFSITVEAEFNREPPVHFKEINVAIDLKGLELDERRKDALLSFIKNCPIHNTLKANPIINLNLA